MERGRRSGRARLGVVLGAMSALLAVVGCAPPVRTAELKLVDAERAYEKGDYSTAAAAVGQFLSSDPPAEDRAAALYLRALVNVRRGARSAAYEDARAAARGATAAETRWRANFVLGTMAFEDGDWASALRAYDAALQAGPAAPPLDVAMFRSGQCLERIGRWPESRTRFAEMARRHPGSSLAATAQRRARLNATHFAIQCGVFGRKANADALVATLRQDRLQPYVVTERRGGADMHVVMHGRYAHFDEAERALREVARFVNQPVIWP